MNEEREVRGPLAGVRVVDLATERAELAGRLLANLGAEVIKVEPPAGAGARFLPPFAAGSEHDADGSLYWATVGLGKRSVVADLATDDGRAAVRRLATSADILIESFDPGTMEGWGLSHRALRALNPGLIYVSVTPYGQTGPHALRPATETTLEAAGGLLGMQGDGDRPPVPVGFPQAAFHAGAQAAVDAIIALNERERCGLGQYLDVSTQAAVVWTLMNATGYPPNTGGDPPTSHENRKKGRTEIAPGVALPNVWRCKDGWVQVSITLSGLGARTLGNLIRLIEAEGELSPAHAASGWTAWLDNIAPGAVPPETLLEAQDELANYFAKRTGEELVRRAVEHMLLLAPIRSVEDLLNSPQLQARAYWQEVGGRLHPGAAAKLSRTPMQLGDPAPTLGRDQHLLQEPGLRPDTGGATNSINPVPGGPLHQPGALGGSNSSRRSRAFEGLKVADFAWVGVGPLIAKAFADHGATVVHVESSGRPDVLRLGPPFKDGEAGIDRSQFFANFNSSKRGLALNLALPEGRELATRLVDWADVVVESFVPGVLEHLGLGYESLAARKPGLVMLSTCLCGQTGPDATYRGFGTQGSALAGIHGLTGWPDRAPFGTWGAYTDFIAPRYGVAALAAAIYEHSRSGRGQHIDLAQVEAAIHFIEPLVLDYTVNGRKHGPAGHTSDRACPHGVYQTAGIERYVAIAIETPAQWVALRGVAPLGETAPPDATLAERMRCAEKIDSVLRDWCADRDPWELVEKLTAAGVPASVVQRPSDLYADPQLAHRGFFVTCEHGVMGPTPYDGPVTIFSETPAALTAAPCLGQHTDEVLRQVLGMSEDEIAEYAATGVFS